MGNPKKKWTAEEEEALRAGIVKHGTGKWKNILRDPEFNHLLSSRNNIDLKDQWRTMSVNRRSSNLQTSAPAVTARDALTPWYNGMIFEAFSTLKDPEGLDTSTIINFIEQWIEGPVPFKFRGFVVARLRSLAQQGKLEKVGYGLDNYKYKLKGEGLLYWSERDI